MAQYGRSDSDLNEERLQHILSEASSHKQHSLSNTDDCRSLGDSKSPVQCLSPFAKEQMKNKYGSPGDLPQEKIARLCQEELAKIMGRAPREAFPR